MKGSSKVFISTILLITLRFTLFGAATECIALNYTCYPQIFTDTIVKNQPSDTLTKPIKISKNTLKSKVDYVARDSIRFDIEKQKLYLYGDANVKYEKIELKAGYVELDFEKNSVFAAGRIDSSGKLVEKPIFSESGKPMNSDTMYYNFKTKKGKIKVITTEEGEGHIAAKIAKKDSNDVTFIRNGHYTTCSLEHPHFYIASNKMKVIPNDKIVTGPAVLFMGDIPTPLLVPFGFFPNRKGRANGILIPTYGDSPSLGFSLQEGGYYFGLGNNFDMRLTGDIYSKGSWAGRITSNYLKRYRHNGSISLRFAQFKLGEMEFDDYRETSDFAILWTHVQDQKANPSIRFSASVNMTGNGSYNRTLPTNTANYLNNAYNSAITWSKSGKYFNFGTALRQNQNIQTHKMDLSFPNATLTMNRIYPTTFLHKEGITKSKWYDKIGVSYSGEFQNGVSMLDRNVIKPVVFDSMKAGFKHNIPLATNFNINPFTISPSLNFNSLWYFDYTRQWYGTVTHTLPDRTVTVDTMYTEKIKDFRTVNTYTAAISATTKIYGFYQLKNSKVKVIRHVITPSISFGYNPDYTLPKYDYFESIYNPYSSKVLQYSYFQNNVFSGPPASKNAGVSFGIGNNLEMKVRPSKKDTADTDNKITLIDNFMITSSYSYITQELAPFNMTLYTTLFKKLNVNMSGMLDPYKLTETGYRYKQLVWNEGKLGTLTSANLSLSTNLNNSKSNKKQDTKQQPEVPKNIDQSAAQFAYVQSHPGYYVDFTVPWNLNLNYNITYSKIFQSTYNESVAAELERKKRSPFIQTLRFSGDFSLTPKWKIGFDSGYDIVNKALTYTNLNVYRDLHCWELRFSWVPFGPVQNYTLNINVKSSVLKDLKLTRQRNWYDYQ